MAISDLLTKKNIDGAVLLISAAFSAFFSAEIGCDICRNSFWKEPVMNVPAIVRNERLKPAARDYLAGISSVLGYDKAVSRKSRISQPSSSQEPEINLQDAVLKGVIAGDSGGFAVILSNGVEHVVTEGESIGSNKIISIYEDRVIMRSEGGALSELSLGYGASALIDEGSGNVSDDESQSSDPSVREVSKREFLDLFEPPDKLMNDIQLSPQAKDGSPYGIRIVALDPKSLMSSKMGLSAGDIILSINNKPLFTPEDGMAAYIAMKNEDEIVFKLDRGGSVSELKVVFR